MSEPGKKPAAKKKKPTTVFFDVVGAEIDGVKRAVLVPSDEVDRRVMREKGYRVGDTIAAVLRKPRNLVFFRLAHRVGGWLVDNVDRFAGLSTHDALKKLQFDSGVGCVEVEHEIEGFGKLVSRHAESLNFDDMDEGRWRELWTGWVGWMRSNVYTGIAPLAVDEVERLIVGEKELWRTEE